MKLATDLNLKYTQDTARNPTTSQIHRTFELDKRRKFNIAWDKVFQMSITRSEKMRICHNKIQTHVQMCQYN